MRRDRRPYKGGWFDFCVSGKSSQAPFSLENSAAAYSAFLVGIPVAKLRQIMRLREAGVRTYVLSNNNPAAVGGISEDLTQRLTVRYRLTMTTLSGLLAVALLDMTVPHMGLPWLDALLAAVNNRVRFDASQSLTVAEQLQARSNIGAVSASDVGNTDTDFVAVFVGALV